MQRFGGETGKVFTEGDGRGAWGRGSGSGGVSRDRRSDVKGGSSLAGGLLTDAAQARGAQAMLVLRDDR